MLVSSLRTIGAGVLLGVEHAGFQLARLFRRRRPLAIASRSPAASHVVLPPPITWRLPRDPAGLPN